MDVVGPLGPSRNHASPLTRDQGRAENPVQAPTRFDRAKTAHWRTDPRAHAAIGTGNDGPFEQAAIPFAHGLRRSPQEDFQ